VTKFSMTVVGDFSKSVASEHVRQAMHVSQTILESTAPEQSETKGGAVKHTIYFHLPGTPLAREDIMDWILDRMRSQYGGPPFVFALDVLDDKFEFEASDPAVEQA